MEWLRENWLQLHLALAPLGTLAVTWLLWLSGGEGWQWWSSRADMGQIGQMAPLGVLVYGSLILVIERSSRMFWALAQREKDIEKGRQEGRAEGRQEGRAEGREEVIRTLLEQKVEVPPEILRKLRDAGQEPPSTG